MSADDRRNTVNIDFGVGKKFWQVGRFANMESTDDVDCLATFKVVFVWEVLKLKMEQ